MSGLAFRLRRMAALPLTVLAIFAITASSCDSTDYRKTRPPRVRGLADFHSHQFAHLGFGRTLHSHDTDPSSPCRQVLPFDDTSFRVRDLVRAGLYDQAAEQQKKGQCYPTAHNLAGQQMDTDSLRRAWQYGLRLLVVLAVNSEFLCKVAELEQNCYDRAAIEAQLQAAHDLEAKIDLEAGGPGQGWYRIVLSPQEARSVIQQGKLAVILGVESAGAYDCGVRYATTIKGIPPLIGSAPDEKTWQSANCGDAFDIEGFGTQTTLARMEHYWNLGARHFFPIHTFNSQIGGTSLNTPMLHAFNNPSQLKPGGIFNKVPDINRTIIGIRPKLETWDCGSTFDFDEGRGLGRCNKLGLTSTGRAFVKHLASYGAIIDVDHMSFLAKRDLVNELGVQYALVSSHTGTNETNHDNKRNEVQITPQQLEDMYLWDGAFAPILRPANSVTELDTYPAGAGIAPHTCGGTTESFIQSYRYVVEKLTSAESQIAGLYQPEPKFVGVGFGSDFNGLAGWPEPRFGQLRLGGGGLDVGKTLRSAFVGDNVVPPPGRCIGYFDQLPVGVPIVQYPFTSPMTGLSFDRSTLPWGGRTEPYDISTDGLAHVGMIPDFIEEMRALGMTDTDLEPLWYGAEAYLRMWENAAGWGSANTYGTEVQLGIRDKCR